MTTHRNTDIDAAIAKGAAGKVSAEKATAIATLDRQRLARRAAAKVAGKPTAPARIVGAILNKCKVPEVR